MGRNGGGSLTKPLLGVNLAKVANFFCPEADFHTGTDLAGLVDDSKSIENPVEFLIDIGGDGKTWMEFNMIFTEVEVNLKGGLWTIIGGTIQ